jgi:transcription termination/antitermination protein NusA
MMADPPNDPDGQVVAAFAREIPEIASGAVVIRAVARTPGIRTNVAVDSDDPEVDIMRTCFGDRGVHLRNIAAVLGGEAIHVTTWSPYPDVMIRNALSPVRVTRVELHAPVRRAVVTVPSNQSPNVLATLDGQRELAVRLSGWDIEIVMTAPGA